MTSLNGVDPAAWVEDVVLADVDATITGPKFVTSLLAGKLETATVRAGKVKPDVVAVADQAIYLDRPQVVESAMAFDEVHVVGNISVEGLFNRHRLPDDYVTLHTRQVGFFYLYSPSVSDNGPFSYPSGLDRQLHNRSLTHHGQHRNGARGSRQRLGSRR